MARLRSLLLIVLAVLAYLGLATSQLWTSIDYPLEEDPECEGLPPFELPAEFVPEPDGPLAAPASVDEGEDRVVVGTRAGACTLRLVSDATPISPLRFLLESEDGGEPRVLSIRDVSQLAGLGAGRYRLRDDESAWSSNDLEFKARAATRLDLEFPIECHGPWTGRVIDGDSALALERVQVRWRVRGELGEMGYQAEQGQRELSLVAGRFSIGCGGFVARSSQLTFEAPEYESFVTPWIEWDGQVPIDLGEIVLRSWTSLGPPLGGRVEAAEDGAPLAGVRVFAVPAGTRREDLWVYQGSLQGAVPLAGGLGMSDARGEFQLAVRGRDLVRLAAYSDERGLVLGDAVPRGPGNTIRMARGAILRGRVLTNESILASGSLRSVSIESSERACIVSLDDELRFELGGLPNGRVRVALQASERQSNGLERLAEVVVQHVELRGEAPAFVELRYGIDSGGSSLQGRVLLPEGIEFETMRAVLWFEGEPSPTRFAVIGLDGLFALGDLPAQPFHVFLGGSSPDASRAFLAMQRWDSPAHLPASVEFDVRAAQVTGEVFKDGAPMAGGLLLVHATSGDPAWRSAVDNGLSLRADLAGAFAIHGLPPGQYEIGRAGGVRRSFELTPGMAGPIELHLE